MMNLKKLFGIICIAVLLVVPMSGRGITGTVVAQEEKKNWVYIPFTTEQTDEGTIYNVGSRLSNTQSHILSLGNDTGDWMDFDGTLVISYDVMIANSAESSKTNPYIVRCYFGHKWLSRTGGNEKTSAAPYGYFFPPNTALLVQGTDTKGKVVNGNPSAPPADLGTGNTPVNVSGIQVTYNNRFESRNMHRWATLTATITRDRDNVNGNGEGVYTVKTYLDGKLIENQYGKAVGLYYPDRCMINGNKTYEYEIRENNETGGQTEFEYITPYLMFSYANEGIADNIKMNIYGETELEDMVPVEPGVTSVEIPVINTSVTDEDAPLEARSGYIMDLEGALENDSVTFKAKKYSSSDVLMKQGTDVTEQVKLLKKNPEIMNIVSPGNLAGECLLPFNGSKIFADIPQLESGERLVLEFDGLKDIMGNELSKSKTVICAGEGISGFDCYDVFGKKLNVSLNENKSIVDSDVKKIEVLYKSDEPLTMCDSDGKSVFTANVLYGKKHVFEFESCLDHDTAYYVKTGDEDIFSFETSGPVKRYGDIEFGNDGKLYVAYSNSFSEAQEAVMLVSSFDEDTQNDMLFTEETLTPKSFGKIKASRILKEGKDKYAFIIDGLQLDSMVENRDIITAGICSDEHKLNVRGELSDGYYSIVMFDSENSPVYARQVRAENGLYDFDINFSGFKTDKYKIAVYTNNGTYFTTVAHSDERNADKLNSADSKEKALELFADTSAMNGLEFAYPLFDRLSDTQKERAAEILAREVKNKSFDTENRVESIKAFKQTVIMAALENKLQCVAEFMDDCNVLADNNVAKWYYNTGNLVSKERNAAWRSGIIERLKAQKANSIYDLQNKFVEALIYEVIKNHGTSGILVECVSDLNNDYIKAGKDRKGKSYISSEYISRLSSDGKTYSKLDEYATLKNDLKNYESSLYYESAGSTYSGGGSGRGMNTVSLSVAGNTDGSSLKQKVKSKFNDMENCEWAVEYVNALYDKGIINGKSEGIFAPNDKVLREEFTKLVVEAVKAGTAETELPFNDVHIDFWAYNYVKRAYAAGIINGISDDLFGIGKFITRQDMAVVIYNALGEKNVSSGAETEFTDKGSIADYAKEAVYNLAAEGILNGYDDKNFRPMDNASRAEAAKVIYMLVEKLERLN